MSASPASRLITKGASTDAFISYSVKDQEIADAVVNGLEAADIRCWIASRNLAPGQDWSAGIPPAIDACKIFILIFSEHANSSLQVAREVHIAQSGNPKHVIPFRVDAVQPGGALRYLLAGLNWLDATGDTRTARIGKLVEQVRRELQPPEGDPESPDVVADLPPNNISPEINTFVGRDHEIDALLQTIRKQNVVSLVGTGGVGKTRLAQECARRMLRSFPEGVWFVNLAPIVDGTLIASTIAEALGIAGAVSDGDALVENLSAKRLFLILDNCEQVLEACADLVERIAQHARDARVLCTSRAPIGVTGECVVRLSPLPLPELTTKAPTLDDLNASPAIRLLLERASTIAPVTLPSASARIAVVEIARQLDGLPLALELAAARTNVLSFEQIAASLDQRFKLLTTGKRGADPRQRTLSAMIDWSYELLQDEERTLLRRLSIFRGGCTLETATAICGDDASDQWQTLDLLASLTDKSLLVVSTDGTRKRYGQLETIREYSSEKLLSAGEAATIGTRRTEIFASIAHSAYQEWDAGPRPEWLSLLSPELDNFRAALVDAFQNPNDTVAGASLAADLGPVFLRLSLLREGIEWCRRAAQTSIDARTTARAYYVLSSLHYNHGEMAAALDAANNAVALYARAGDERGHTRALSQVAQLSARHAYHAEARAAADEAVKRARVLGDDRLLAGVLQRSAVTFEATEIENARAQFSECLRLFRSLKREDEIARALIWWTRAEAEAECFERARELSMQALRGASIGDYELALKSNIAFFSLVLGDELEASKYARDALELAFKLRSALMTAIVISYVAVLLRERAPDSALRLLGYAEARLDQLNWQQTSAEEKIHAELQSPLRHKFSSIELDTLLSEGASMSEDIAVAEALRLLSTG